MRKVLRVMLLCILVCFLLLACQKSDTKTLVSDVEENLAKPDATSEVIDKVLSKEQVMQIFTNEKDRGNRVITGCVVADDMAYGLTGIVQYTDKNGNACNLAFVKDTWSYPIGLDAENLCVIADDSDLTYQGNGIVKLSLKDPGNDVIYDYTVEYSCDDNDTKFIASSSIRK